MESWGRSNYVRIKIQQGIHDHFEQLLDAALCSAVVSPLSVQPSLGKLCRFPWYRLWSSGLARRSALRLTLSSYWLLETGFLGLYPQSRLRPDCRPCLVGKGRRGGDSITYPVWLSYQAVWTSLRLLSEVSQSCCDVVPPSTVRCPLQLSLTHQY
jgi:hypothetical protein